jgi:hypothetical protein
MVAPFLQKITAGSSPGLNSYGSLCPWYAKYASWNSRYGDSGLEFRIQCQCWSHIHSYTGVYVRAVCEQLKRVRGFAIVVPFVASMPLRLHSPINHAIPVATLSNLTIANMVCCRYGHGRVICHAHDVLSQAVQTVVNVVQAERLVFVVVLGDDSLADEFLSINQSRLA